MRKAGSDRCNTFKERNSYERSWHRCFQLKTTNRQFDFYAADLIAVFPKDDNTKLLVRQAVQMLNVASETVESLRVKMNETASQLPEYPVVMGMDGVGPTLGPQLMAEIGDVTRFTKKGALTAYAGVDPRSNESGDYKRKSDPTTKKGSPYLRKTLFQVMDGLIKRSPANDPVYAFMDKKRSEGLTTST